MQSEDLYNRFTFHPVKNPEQGELYSSVRAKAYELAQYLDSVAPDSRELSLAITALEEAVFWTNAAIARHGED
jgi:hypothetical protein